MRIYIALSLLGYLFGAILAYYATKEYALAYKQKNKFGEWTPEDTNWLWCYTLGSWITFFTIAWCYHRHIKLDKTKKDPE